MTYYYTDDALDLLGAELIAKHHPHLEGSVRFLFRNQAAKSRGQAIWGKADLITGRAAFLATPPDELAAARALYGVAWVPKFFVVEIAADIWKGLTPLARRALVDHELSHCEQDDDREPTLIGHDLEEFLSIALRYGPWRPGMHRFGEALQANLFAEALP